MVSYPFLSKVVKPWYKKEKVQAWRKILHSKHARITASKKRTCAVHAHSEHHREKVLTLPLQQHRKKVAITSSKVWKNWISYLFQHCGYGIYKPKKTNRIFNKISNIPNTQPRPRVIFFKKTAFFLKQKDALGTRLPHLQRNFTKKIRRPLIIVKGCTEYEVETYCWH